MYYSYIFYCAILEKNNYRISLKNRISGVEEKFCSTDFELQISLKCFYLALFIEEARNNDQLSNKHRQPQDYSLDTTSN